MAQRLPVRAVPEELFVPLVRDDVVNLGRRRGDAVPCALCAKRMPHEEQLRRPEPCVRVAALGARAPHASGLGFPLALLGVLLAIEASFLRVLAASRMRARPWKLRRHRHPSLRHITVNRLVAAHVLAEQNCSSEVPND